MERIRHIAETHKPNTEPGETFQVREEIHQHNEYDQASETHPEQIRIRECLNSIDEALLKEIVKEYFRRSGNEEGTINWIPIDKIRITHNTVSAGTVNNSAVGNYSNDDGITIFDTISHGPKQILWTLIHEQLHSISSVKQNEEDDFFKTGVEVMWGKQKSESGDMYQFVAVEEFNEAITEQCTEEVFLKYLQQSGQDIFGDKETYQRFSDQTYIMGEYGNHQQVFEVYLLGISAISKVPEETVRDSFFRAYLRNGFLTSEEIFDFLGENNEELVGKLTRVFESRNWKMVFDFFVDLNKEGLMDNEAILDFLEKFKTWSNKLQQRADNILIGIG